MNSSEADNRMKCAQPSDTLDIREVAAALKCHPVTVRRMIQAGRFPRPIRVGAALRIRRSDLKAWMDAGGAVGLPKVETRSLAPADRRSATNAAALSVRSDGGRRVLTGYGAVFYRAGDAGTEYEMSPGVFERVNPGAFTRALDSRADVVCAFNHNVDYLLGRTSSGTLQLSVDAVGLRYEVDLPDTATGRDVGELARRGDLRGSSFSFAIRAKRDYGNGDRAIRELLDVDLYELGPVWSPAYAGATATLAGTTGGRASGDADLVAVELALMEMDATDDAPAARRGATMAGDLAALDAVLAGR